MNEKQYLNRLQYLIDNVTENNAKDTIKELDCLYSIKPVRTKWYAAKAIAMYKNKCSADKIYQILANKYYALYDYDGIDDIFNLNIKLSEDRQQVFNVNRLKLIVYKLHQMSNSSNDNEDEFIASIENRNINLYKKFLNGDISEDIIIRILNHSYMRQNFVVKFIFDMLRQQLYLRESRVRPWVKQIPNTGELLERLKTTSDVPFVVVTTDMQDLIECQAIATALAKLGKSVYLLDVPMQFSVENPVELQDTVSISLDNIEILDNIKIIHPIELIYENESIGINTDYILDFIHANELKNKHSLLISSGYFIDQLCQSDVLNKKISRLYDFITDYQERTMSFAWCGDYLDYIKVLYNLDVREKLNASSTCKFSIVIPARNSVDTLRYTIKTCLEQSYNGEYEIVISDNSSVDRTDIYELCKEINNPRIVYIRTPRNLPLPKSFEYAYVHAKGEYILALGSDDGLLPWGLEVLDTITRNYPQEEIIQWERGFYAWPSFSPEQEHQFVIPRKYQKGKYNCYYRKKENYLASILQDPSTMYALPMLYINSCFKRTYFKTLLNKTGRLWNGICQDIYMGIVTACINNQIFNLAYPITIAGMSKTSIGANAQKATLADKELQKMLSNMQNESNIGAYCRTYLERLLPNMWTDTGSLYLSILRAISIGILPLEYIEKILPWKTMFNNLISQLDIRDVAIDKKIHIFRYAAMQHGEDFLKWFDNAIYNSYKIPQDFSKIEKKKKNNVKPQKIYQEGVTDDGGMVLDASKYGVQNIYDATKLFKQLW